MKIRSFLKTFYFLHILATGIFAQSETAKLLSFEPSGNVELTRPRIYQAGKTEENLPISSAEILNLEQQAFLLINQKRMEIGQEHLTWNNDCAKIARLHSRNMASYKFFSHTGLDGSMVNDRADEIGLSKWRAIGENIAFNLGYENPLEKAIDGWLKSTTHRENILNNRWKESAVGIAVSVDGAYYFTQVFLLRK